MKESVHGSDAARCSRCLRQPYLVMPLGLAKTAPMPCVVTACYPLLECQRANSSRSKVKRQFIHLQDLTLQR
jgi:hypothetical protein